MSEWTLFAADLDGFPLEIETVDDGFEKAIARYEIPYRDGAILEDLGLKARVITIRCYFWDDNSDHQTYGSHVDFANSLKENRKRTLAHPMYGEVTGYVERFNVKHDDRVMCAEVDIVFVEESRADLAAVEYEVVDIDEAVAADYVAAQQQMMDSLADEVAAEINLPVSMVREKILDPLTSLADQFTGITQKGRNYLKRLDSFVAAVQSELTEIAQPANSITSAVNYGLSLPGRVIGALSQTCERYKVMYDTAEAAPDRFIDNINNAIDSMQSRLGYDKQVSGAKSAQVNYAAAELFKADQVSRDEALRAEPESAISLDGRVTPREQSGTVMTTPGLEQVLAIAGDAANAAIALDRSVEGVKAGYLRLVDHVSRVKLDRENIVRIEVGNPTPLHLLCHHYGLPYSAAERVYGINDIEKPNETRGAVNMYVR